jgi:hypothetical protein
VVPKALREAVLQSTHGVVGTENFGVTAPPPLGLLLGAAQERCGGLLPPL